MGRALVLIRHSGLGERRFVDVTGLYEFLLTHRIELKVTCIRIGYDPYRRAGDLATQSVQVNGIFEPDGRLMRGHALGVTINHVVGLAHQIERNRPQQRLERAP